MFTVLAVTVALIVVAGDRIVRVAAFAVSFVAHFSLFLLTAVLRLMVR